MIDQESSATVPHSTDGEVKNLQFGWSDFLLNIPRPTGGEKSFGSYSISSAFSMYDT